MEKIIAWLRTTCLAVFLTKRRTEEKDRTMSDYDAIAQARSDASEIRTNGAVALRTGR